MDVTNLNGQIYYVCKMHVVYIYPSCIRALGYDSCVAEMARQMRVAHTHMHIRYVSDMYVYKMHVYPYVCACIRALGY